MVRPDNKTILLDANLLVLLVVGSASQRLITRHKKTKTFTPGDYDLLTAVLGKQRVLITPHVAAEAANLLSYHPQPERALLLAALKVLLDNIEERYVASRYAASQQEFRYLGLTDAAMLTIADEVEILTTDTNLYIAALRRGATAINFNHLR